MLGLFEDMPFPTTRVCLAPGDTLVGYTDGVDEAFDSGGEVYGTSACWPAWPAWPPPRPPRSRPACATR